MSFDWIIIKFKNGSNPYICKTEREFKRMSKKYSLILINEDLYLAEDK